MTAGRYDSWESYFYPETYDDATGQGVLRNRFETRDGSLLLRLEYGATQWRDTQLAQGDVAIPQTMDGAHLRAIHRHLFQDVYEWAGQDRAVNMWKGPRGGFAIIENGRLDRHLDEAARIVGSTDWPSLDREGFAQAIAATFAHVNQAHPFREGNGRATKRFLHDVAARSPFALEFERVPPAMWNAQSDRSRPEHNRYFNTHPEAVVPVFRLLAVPRPERTPQTSDARAADELRRMLARTRTAYPRAATDATERGASHSDEPPTRRIVDRYGRGLDGPLRGR